MSTSGATGSQSKPSSPGNIARRAEFLTTHWSVVLSAGRSDSTHAKDALAQLCQTYWYPLYAYVRQRGYAPADAQDLTQEFFARLLEKKSLGGVTREGGKFRSFLLATLNHFLVDEWKKAKAQKRGGGQIVSLDAQEAETRFGREPADSVTPEILFEQNWALALLDSVFQRLKREHESEGRTALFESLKFALTGARSAVPYAAIATQLDMPESTVKVAVHRLRRRYRELLREEVANTVDTPEEVEEELRSLFRALAQ